MRPIDPPYEEASQQQARETNAEERLAQLYATQRIIERTRPIDVDGVYGGPSTVTGSFLAERMAFFRRLYLRHIR